MKLSVDYTADNEFKRSNDSAARQTADKKPFCLDSEACNINQQICKSSRERHSPVREAAECNFYSAVQYGSEAVNK